jgi:hypothetical protein
MMRRPFFRLVLVLAALLAPLGNVGLAAPPPRTSPAAALDLAAMVLFQPDLNNPDAWIKNGTSYGTDAWSGQAREHLESAGYLHGIQVSFSTTPYPKEDFLIYSFADEFKNADGAADGITVLEDVNGATIETGTRTIGDESELLRWSGTDENSGRPMHELIEVFRVGRLTGAVDLLDFSLRDPAIAQVEALSDIAVARLRAGLAGESTGPGLGARIVHYNLNWDLTFRDGYMRLGGKPMYGKDDVAAGPPGFDQFYAGATDVYFFGQSLNSKPDAPSTAWRVASFDTEAAASAWAANYIPLNETGDGAWTVDSQPNDVQIGDDTHIATYHLAAGANAPKPTIDGAIVVARFGTLGVAARLQGFAPVSAKIVEALMTAEAACLSAGALPCAAIAPPTNLSPGG